MIEEEKLPLEQLKELSLAMQHLWLLDPVPKQLQHLSEKEWIQVGLILDRLMPKETSRPCIRRRIIGRRSSCYRARVTGRTSSGRTNKLVGRDFPIGEVSRPVPLEVTEDFKKAFPKTTTETKAVSESMEGLGKILEKFIKRIRKAREEKKEKEAKKTYKTRMSRVFTDGYKGNSSKRIYKDNTKQKNPK